ncbi:MAG: hypothetical protein K2H86_01380 [Muribaculaceae bacterium]|nr:hypothetical protein [Muribaculaceae bacterium]
MTTPQLPGQPKHWYIAIVNYNTEKAVEARLAGLGYEAYVAKQTVTRVRPNGRKVSIDKVFIPLTVFIHCTETERRQIVNLPYIKRFMTNRAAAAHGSTAPIATLEQREIDKLRYMLGQSEIQIAFVNTPIKINDNVTVARGHLKGISGRVIATDDTKSEVIVAIGMLGAAKMTINTSHLKLTE